MNDTYAVELRNVVKRFGDLTAVDHINLQIAHGEFFSLLGPSGCGKTTSLRMIAGFEMPDEGAVIIAGEEQGYLPPYQRPVNTVFQNYALFPHMTVWQNVAFGLEMKKLDKNEIRHRVEEALSMVHLLNKARNRPKQLSGGQQQRVALARALVNRPKVLLLDEPLGALDLKLRKAMQIELKALQEQVGITFIYVTHDQGEALAMSDHIAVMNKGRVLQIGSPEEIYEAPQNRFVADFIGETNFLDVTVESCGQCKVSLSGHVIPATWAGEPIAQGERVTLSIRPEKITIAKKSADTPAHIEHPVRIQGKITHLVYLGTDTHYTVQLSNGDKVIVRTQNKRTASHFFQRGEDVSLFWHAHHGRIMKE